MATGMVAPLREEAADGAFWRAAWAQHWQGKTWRDITWFHAETYFYRRLLEAVRYFQAGPWHLLDPFASHKRTALHEGLDMLAGLYADETDGISPREQFIHRLRGSLWGNRVDLSNIAVVRNAADNTGRQSDDLLLVDHGVAVWEMLRGGVARVDVVADNSGSELLADLALLDLLLSADLAREVHLHLKAYPFFVSDVTVRDLEETWRTLAASPEVALQTLARRLLRWRAQGRVRLHDDPFWTRCLLFRQMPDDVRATLARADLVVFKGDANYRRLVDDAHWPHTARLEDVAAYMPTSFVTLRTLKAEVMVGLDEGRAEAIAAEDADWLVNGKRGVIHLVRRDRPGD
jgi:hypothetical protein